MTLESIALDEWTLFDVVIMWMAMNSVRYIPLGVNFLSEQPASL